MANPVPEIMPDLALAAGAAVVGTGRSDFPNQINSVLAFPALFRGALDVRASDINSAMNIAVSDITTTSSRGRSPRWSGARCPRRSARPPARPGRGSE
jgi:malic enzyme